MWKNLIELFNSWVDAPDGVATPVGSAVWLIREAFLSGRRHGHGACLVDVTLGSGVRDVHVPEEHKEPVVCACRA
jgi:hypothetical protein